MSRRAPSGGRGHDGATRSGRAVALLAVVVIIAVLLLRHVGTTATTPAAAGRPTTTTTVTAPAAATTTTSTTVAAIPPAQVKVLVLNGTLAGVLAGDASRALKANPGFNTLNPDNTTAKVPSSEVYAASAQYLPSAQAIAALYGIPASEVSTPIPASAPIASAERTIADVVFIIGPEIASKVGAG